jgi:hypothetical protein
MIFLMIAAQAAATLPDIEFKADVRARSLTVEKQGEARLSLTTEPEGENIIDVQAPKANGRKTLRNVRVNVRAEARIGDPQQGRQRNAGQEETGSRK